MEKTRRRVWVGVVLGFTALMVVLLIVLDEKQLLWLSTKEVYAMAVPATLLPIAYTVFFPWWKAPLGRALFINKFGLLMLVDLTVLFLIVDPFWVEHLSFIAYTTVLVGMSYQLIVMVKIWWATRKERAGQRYRAYASYDEHEMEKIRARHEAQREVDSL